MAYATGSAASAAGVLQSLAAFCTSYGWTVDHNASYGGGAGWWLAVHKGTCYLNYQVPASGGMVALYGATGYNSSATPSTQANTGPGVGCSFGASLDPGNNPIWNDGPYSAYHFFSSTSGTYLHVVVEISAGLFGHCHAGQLNTVGGAGPCTYLTGSFWYTYIPQSGADTNPSNPDAFGNAKAFCWDDSIASIGQYGGLSVSNIWLYCTVDSVSRWFGGFQVPSPARLLHADYSLSVNHGLQGNMTRATPNQWNGISPLIAIPYFAERITGNIYSPVGEAPDVRLLNMKNNNGLDEITIGTDVWKVFPQISNNPATVVRGGQASSFPYGLAFLKSA